MNWPRLAIGLGPAIGLLGCSLIAGGMAIEGFVLVGAALTFMALALRVGLRAQDDLRRAELEARIVELEKLEERLRLTGVSPVEQAYHHLLEEARPNVVSAADIDRKLEGCIQARCDSIWQGIREHRYVRRVDGRITDLDGGALFRELSDIVQEVATLYHGVGKPAGADGPAGSVSAVLAARTGDIALAIRAIAGDALQLVQQLPVVDPASWSVGEVLTRLEKVEKGLELYRKIAPYDRYLTGAMIGARLAIGSNPISLAAWYLGKEGAVRVGSSIVKSRAEAWLKQLLESTVAMTYVQIARTYAPHRAYQTLGWFTLAEALAVNAALPGIDRNRRLLLGRILTAPIPDEFAKLELLRALAEDRAVDPRAGPDIVEAQLTPAQRKQVADELSLILSDLRGLAAPAARSALSQVEGRLGWSLRVDTAHSGSPFEAQAVDGLDELALLALTQTPDPRAAQARLVETPFAKAAAAALGEATFQRELERAVAAAGEVPPRLVEPPRSLVADELAPAFVQSLVELLATDTGFPPENDQQIALSATVLLDDRKRRQAVWASYLEHARARLEDLTALGVDDSFPLRATLSAVRRIGAGERALAALHGQLRPAGRPRWLLLFTDRVIIGRVPHADLHLEEPEIESFPLAAIELIRERHRLVDDLVLRAGDLSWTVQTDRKGSFERRFASLLAALGRPLAEA